MASCTKFDQSGPYNIFVQWTAEMSKQRAPSLLHPHRLLAGVAALIRIEDTTTTDLSRRAVINATGAAGAGIDVCHRRATRRREITRAAAFYQQARSSPATSALEQ
jgi:hypothetical protein